MCARVPPPPPERCSSGRTAALMTAPLVVCSMAIPSGQVARPLRKPASAFFTSLSASCALWVASAAPLSECSLPASACSASSVADTLHPRVEPLTEHVCRLQAAAARVSSALVVRVPSRALHDWRQLRVAPAPAQHRHVPMALLRKPYDRCPLACSAAGRLTRTTWRPRVCIVHTLSLQSRLLHRPRHHSANTATRGTMHACAGCHTVGGVTTTGWRGGTHVPLRLGRRVRPKPATLITLVSCGKARLGGRRTRRACWRGSADRRPAGDEIKKPTKRAQHGLHAMRRPAPPAASATHRQQQQ